MRRRRAFAERARAAGSVFLWEAAVVIATIVAAFAISAIVLALV